MYRVTSSQMTNADMARNTEEPEIMALYMHTQLLPSFQQVNNWKYFGGKVCFL